MSYALDVHFTPCQNQYTTKWVKLESIHDNTSFNSSKSHFPLPTSLYCQENWCWEFWKTINSIKWKIQMTSEHKQEACKIISWVTDKRITIHSARISIYFLQNSKCIINILAEEVGEHWKREVLSLKEGKFQKICTFFLIHIKNAWTWYLLCATDGILFSVSKGIKITFMFIV